MQGKLGHLAITVGIMPLAGAIPLPAAAQPGNPAELAEIRRALGADALVTPGSPPPSFPLAQVARAASSPNPAVSVIADLAAAMFSGASRQTGGHDPKQNGLNLQALEMAAGADVDPYFKFNANIVLGHSGVEIEELVATTTALPGGLQVRAGELLTRFGRINTMHPHQWDFVDQPLVIGRMLGEDGNRGLGAEISWLTPLPWYAEIVLSETTASGEGCARSCSADEDLGGSGPLDLETMIAWKQFHALSPDWSLAVGVSGVYGRSSAFRGAASYLLGADLYLKYRPITRQSTTIVSLQAEAIARRRETPAGTLADTGLYAQLVWRFAERWATGARYDFVSGAPGDYLDPEWDRARHRATTNVTFYPTEFSRLRLQGSADVPTWERSPVYAAFLALEVAVGAHGAHAF